MGALTESPGLPLWSDYTGFVRRHRVWIAVLMDVGLVVGLVWSLTQPVTYSATASVTLTPVPVYVMRTTNELVPPKVSIDTDAQLLQSPKVLEPVGAALGQDAVSAADHLSVTASPNSHVLHVTVASTSAERAALAADAAVTALVGVRRHALGSLRRDEIRQLRLLVSGQERLLAQSQARRLVLPAGDELFTSLLDLRTRVAELQEARRQSAEVVRSALVPTEPDRANTEVPVTSGAMLGLLAGCLLGAARDRTRLSRAQSPAPPSGQRPDATHSIEDYANAV